MWGYVFRKDKIFTIFITDSKKDIDSFELEWQEKQEEKRLQQLEQV